MDKDIYSLPTSRKRLALGLRIAIAQAGLTQSAVAERMQVSPSYIAQLCRGAKNPSLEIQESLANALNIRVGEIYELGDRAMDREAEREHEYRLKKLERERSLEAYRKVLPGLTLEELQALQEDIQQLISKHRSRNVV